VKRYLKKIAALSAAVTLAITGTTGIFESATPTATAAGEFRSTLGKEFWVHWDSNYDATNFSPRLFIAAASDASVVITYPDGSTETVSVLSGAVADVDADEILNSSAVNSGADSIKDVGVHIVSDAPIGVYLLNLRNGTSDASVAYPSNFLGKRYRIVSADPVSNVEDRFSVLAVESGTTSVQITPKSSYGSRTSGTTFTVSLEQGEAYTALAANLQGSLVVADKNVAVSTSANCANFGRGSCDHVTEWLAPTDTWGKNFLLPRTANTETEGDRYVVVADEDGTTVNVNGTPVSLDAGDSHSFTGGTSSPSVEVVSSDKKIAVMQFVDQGLYTDGITSTIGDPATIMMVPNEQFLNDVLIATPGTQFSVNQISIIAKTSDVGNITLDGTAVGSGNFSAISGTDYSVAAVNISQGDHRITSTDGFQIYTYGYNTADSYAYAGGTGLVDTVANPGGTADTGFRSIEQVIQESGGGDTTPTPAPYTGPIISDIGEDNIAAPYQTFGGQTVRVDGDRLSGVTKVFIDGKEGTVISTADDHFMMIAPEGLTPGIYNLEVQSSLGNLTYLDGFVVTDASANFSAANAVCDGVEPSWWTQRISDTQAKAYIKCPAVGEKYRILQQTGGSGEYTSIFAKTLTDENDTTQVFNEFGRYIVRTIDLEGINRIRIRVDDVELWKVRYNNPPTGVVTY
jgi:hypothetical protein